MTKDDVVAEARKQLGTPFRHQGRISGLALDCAGLVVTVAKALGVPHIDAKGYGRSPNGALEDVLAAQSGIEQVSKADMQAGDILTMRFGKLTQHLGICAGDTVIHSYEAVGKCCEHTLDATWRGRIVRVYRFKGIL